MIPDAGDIVWIDLDPVTGTEQAGRRPGIVITDRAYHEVSSRAVICPITTRRRDWPTEYPLPDGLVTRGVVLVDQVRSIDRAERHLRRIEQAPPEVLRQVRGRLAELLRLTDLIT